MDETVTTEKIIEVGEKVQGKESTRGSMQDRSMEWVQK